MKRRRGAIAAILAAVAIIGGGLVASTALAGFGNISTSYDGKTCAGYGATGDPPSGANAVTDATSASGLDRSECLRVIDKVRYCDEWGCYYKYNLASFAYLIDSSAGAYDSWAKHSLGVPIGMFYVTTSTCTASWVGGTYSCP
jgi:hypothetical protein